ncbi:keratin, type I cytoskeletal 50 kDa-like [Engraulis encrasicolus]|uniref:keratin, type I cytoskeletal 50 kDa-like n=1 Tax=Engraulis encrasicolus TaxID=184585 RepID=UPI002FD68A17
MIDSIRESLTSENYLSSSGSSSAASLSGGSVRASILRAGSVYGGAGGAGVRISGASRMLTLGGGAGGGAGFGLAAGGGAGFGLAAGGGAGFGLLALSGAAAVSGKFAMQNLNDRLAAYLVKVSTLEKANAGLELKIRQFLDSKTTVEAHDYRAYMTVISELQAKIQALLTIKGSVHLTIDNAQLALDDFKLKYENELSIRQTVEADVAGLKAVLGDLVSANNDLTARMAGYQEDLAVLKKDHAGDLLALRAQIGHKVNVEVDAAPQGDLMAVLAGVREHYEAVAAKNRKELEAWFHAKTESLKTAVTTSTATLQVSSSEMTTMKSTLQTLQIELMAITGQKASLETSLAEKKMRFAAMLAGFQSQVTSLEAQLAQLRAGLETQSADYQLLLDIKTKLEMEIAQYSRLLEGNFSAAAAASSSSSTRTKFVTVTEELVDGKVVSSSASNSSYIPRLS